MLVADARVADPPLRPSLLSVVRRVSGSLLVSCVVPAVLFYACFVLAGVWTAILAALAWAIGATAWRAVTGRRTSGLLVLVAVLMTGRTLLALLADSPWLYFLQPIISDGIVAVAFLASLAMSRPLVARLAGDFYPLDEELSARPRVRRLFWHLTLLWGLLAAAKATVTLWLLHSQTLETFVLVKSITMTSVNVVAAFTTIGLAALVARREGLMGSRRLVPLPVRA